MCWRALITAALLVVCSLQSLSDGTALAAVPAGKDELVAQFANPPASARPRVWWHWIDGNVSERGIKLDLEWMHRAGIGGLQLFDAAFPIKLHIRRRIVYMSPEWQRALKVTAETAADLGLELSISGAPGWSESGGPWVSPEEAMKKLVWSEAYVEGGRFVGKLRHPPTTIGPFQSLPIDYGKFSSGGVPRASPHEVYGNVAVVACRLRFTEPNMAELGATASSSAGPVQGAKLWDEDLQTAVSVPFGKRRKSDWVQISLDSPQTVRSVTIGLPDYISEKNAVLSASMDGKHFTRILQVPTDVNVIETLAFHAVRARYFRLRMFRPAPLGADGIEFLKMKNLMAHRVTEFVLHSDPRVARAEEKAGFFVGQHLEQSPTPKVDPNLAIRQSDILDITSKLRPDGSLDWTAPAGHWLILWFGYSLIGTTNHPASVEATGLEVDKLSRTHVENSYREYLDQLNAILGPRLMGSNGLQGMVNDSWEAGAQNWTESLPAEFAARRGYSLIRFLPALTGRIVTDEAVSEKFLWDFRKTLSELVAENHYRTIADELHRRHMIYYAEAHEVFRAFIGDGMATKRFADVPMGAMWAGGDWTPRTGDADIRESASVAHLYGKPFVAAESFTANNHFYAYTPEMLKPIADRAMAQGLNRFVIHGSVHQPLNDPGPGFTLGPFGQWFTRHETWAEQARPWVDYLSRSSYLLQQGQPVSDILFYYGEDTNITELYGQALPAVPDGFNFDFLNPGSLDHLAVRNGKLLAPSGTSYRVLVVDPRVRYMSLGTLSRLHDLVVAGATLVSARPRTTPSLADNLGRFDQLADALWGRRRQAVRRVGRGKVINATVSEAIRKMQLEPDVQLHGRSAIQFVHRQTNDGDIYFLCNTSPRRVNLTASFRVAGKAAEIWHAETGTVAESSYRLARKRTEVPLQFRAHDAMFIVFRKPAMRSQLIVPQRRYTRLETLQGPWDVTFSISPGSRQIHLVTLQSWTQSTLSDVKYYSGTAIYRRSIDVQPALLNAKTQIDIDLGKVRDVAEVLVNDRPVGILWKSPYRLEISGFLRSGVNRLEVRVTNSWANRLIGDKQPGATLHASAAYDPYNADSALLPSGLLGPVVLWKNSADCRKLSLKTVRRLSVRC